MNESVMVSAIMPVYNPDLALFDTAIRSILSQTFASWELIIINDGSDEYLEHALREYLAMDSRVKLYNTDHIGVSGARNLGLQNSVGQVVTMVDCDDFLSPSAFLNIVNAMNQHDLDFLISSISCLEDNTVRTTGVPCASGAVTIIDKPSEIREVADYFAGFLARKKGVLSSDVFRGVGGKAYRGRIAREIRYDERIKFGEDAVFNAEYALRCRRIGFNDNPWYTYVMHGSSSSTNIEILKDFERYFGSLSHKLSTLGFGMEQICLHAVYVITLVVRRAVQSRPSAALAFLRLTVKRDWRQVANNVQFSSYQYPSFSSRVKFWMISHGLSSCFATVLLCKVLFDSVAKAKQ